MRGAAKGLQEEHLARFANVFGSPNITAMSHVCFVPRVNASKITYGFAAIPDFECPPASIMVWGANLANTLHYVNDRVSRAVERGAKLVVIDPTKIDLAERANLWLKPRPGSDLALVLGMLNVIINEGLYDGAFVDEWTVGFDELRAHVEDYSPENVSDITWVPAETIEQAARFYGTHKPACIQWGNGIDQGVNSFQTARALCILRAIAGNLEIPGGELNWSPPPLLQRGSPAFSLLEKIPPEVRQKRITTKDGLLPIVFYALPQGAVNAIQYGDPYPIRAVYFQGANPLLSYTHAQRVYQALLKLDFLAVSDMFMTPTAALADIVLPVATYLEFDSILVPHYSVPVALAQQKAIRVGECRSDFEILDGIARKLGLEEYVWDTQEQCLNAILEPAGITFHEFKKIGFIQGKKRYQTYQSQGFATPSGKVELYSEQLEGWGFDPLPTYKEPPETAYSAPQLVSEYPFLLTSSRCAHYRHSGGRQIASLRGAHPEPLIHIHPQAAQNLAVGDGDWVYVETKRGKMKQKVTLSADIDPRVVVAEYGWWFPEDGLATLYGWEKSNINMLTDDQPPFNRETGATNMRGMLCRVYKA
jgi:anaerobic selenocysteine-containing dehydrogenase